MWKKWDKDTWYNTTNGHWLRLKTLRNSYEVRYRVELGDFVKQGDFWQTYNTKEEALAFIEEFIK